MSVIDFEKYWVKKNGVPLLPEERVWAEIIDESKDVWTCSVNLVYDDGSYETYTLDFPKEHCRKTVLENNQVVLVVPGWVSIAKLNEIAKL